MEDYKHMITLEKFLLHHQISMIPTARFSHYGRRFSRFFPEIAKMANPSGEKWSRKRMIALAEIVAGLDPSSYRKDNAAAEFKVSEARKSLNKTKAFLQSPDWRRLRYEVLRERGKRCECCGAVTGEASRGGMVRIEVDHIKPISKFWHLRLDRENLQVLCRDCNSGKSNIFIDDHRKKTDHSRTSACS